MKTQKKQLKMVQERFSAFNLVATTLSTPNQLLKTKRSLRAVSLMVLFLSVSFSCFSQETGTAIMIRPGEVVALGDTLQLSKGTLGNLYAHISYKYVGIPSIMVKRKGPLSAQYEGNVVFVSKVDQNKAIIILTGIPYYKLECNVVKAFSDGEIKKFRKLKSEVK
jgi:hypothetical protein